jgi:hypothetical protein
MSTSKSIVQFYKRQRHDWLVLMTDIVTPTPRQYVHTIVSMANLMLSWQRELYAATAAGDAGRELVATMGVSRCEAHMSILRTKLYMVARR